MPPPLRMFPQAFARACLCAAMLVAPASLRAAPGPREPFEAHVPVAPSPVAIDGKRWLIYELHLANLGDLPLEISTLEVLGESARVVHTFAAADIATMLVVP